MSLVARDRVVLSYSLADAPWVERLRKRLEDLEALGLLEVREMRATWSGPRWREERQEVVGVLGRARVAVLLVSPDYLASELVAENEMYRLVAYQHELKVVWIPVRPCDFATNSLCSYPALLDALRPSLAEMDEEGAERTLGVVAGKILRLLERPWPWPDLEIEPRDHYKGLDLKRSARSADSVQLGHAIGLEPNPRQPVHLGASAPRVVEPGEEFTARFAAYHPELAQEVRRQLEKAGARSRAHLDLSSALWRVGTIVTVQLSGDGLEVSPSSQDFVWEGQEHYLDFDVRARKGPSYVTRLKFDVHIGGFVLARLRLDLAVRESRLRLRNYVFAEAPRTAFASYASEDRPRVLDRVAAIRIAAGLDVFMDCLSLNPSERWRSYLEMEILARDVFMLFWSEWAARSSWVEWEWRYALERKGLDAIQAHPLDPWPKGPLPEELSALHFGDPLMAVREAALPGYRKLMRHLLVRPRALVVAALRALKLFRAGAAPGRPAGARSRR